MARPHIVWTEEMIDILICDYPITFDDVLAEKLGVSISTLRRKAAELKLSSGETVPYAQPSADSLGCTCVRKDCQAHLQGFTPEAGQG